MTYECSICIEPLDIPTRQPTVIPCGHTFHRECVETWIYMANKCPICNAVVGSDEITTVFFSKSNDDDGQGVVLESIREDLVESLTRLDSLLLRMNQKPVENHQLRRAENINMELKEEISTIRRELADTVATSEFRRIELDIINGEYRKVLQELHFQKVETRILQSQLEALSKETERIGTGYWNAWAELEELKSTKEAGFD